MHIPPAGSAGHERCEQLNKTSKQSTKTNKSITTLSTEYKRTTLSTGMYVRSMPSFRKHPTNCVCQDIRASFPTEHEPEQKERGTVLAWPTVYDELHRGRARAERLLRLAFILGRC